MRAPVMAATVDDTDRMTPGKRLGRYMVVGQSVRRGPGVTARAYDPLLSREVSLTFVHADELSLDGRERFLEAKWAMAKIAHPNVAAVYDVATIDGHVVTAMEHVEGPTLTAWIEEKREAGAWRDIVAAFVAAGQGIAATHAAGLVHGGFDPSSVVVGNDGRARVTDVGSAYVLDASEAVPDPELDQHAFCVALRESLDAVRAAVPARLIAAIERGASQERSERWPSMQALLAALSRDDRRRLMPWAAGASAMAVLGAAGVAGGSWLEARAQRCTGGAAQVSAIWDAQMRAGLEVAIAGTGVEGAEATGRSVGERLDAYAVEWATRHRDACEATTVRGEQPALVMDLRMACLHGAKAQMRAVVDLFAHADAASVRRARNVLGGLPELDRCSDPDALQSDVQLPSSADKPAVEALEERLAQARVLSDAGKYADAKSIIDAVEREAHAIGYRPLLSKVWLLLGMQHFHLNDLVGAGRILRKAFVSALRNRQQNIALTAASNLIKIYGWFEGRVQEANAFVPVCEGLVGTDIRTESTMRAAIGVLYQAQGRIAEAEREYRRVDAIEEQRQVPERRRIVTKSNLASIAQRLGRYEEAERAYRDLLAQCERHVGPEHPYVVGVRANFGIVLEALGRFDESEAMYRQALALAEKVHGPGASEVGVTLNNLGMMLGKLARHAEAQELLRRSVALWENLPRQPSLAFAYAELGRSYASQGRYAEAQAHLQSAVRTNEQLPGFDQTRAAEDRRSLGLVLDQLGRHDEAYEHLCAALRIVESRTGPDSPLAAAVRGEVGAVLAALGRREEAVAELRAALAVLEAKHGAEHPDVARVRERLRSIAAR